MDASTGDAVLRRFSTFVDVTAGEAEVLRALPSFTDRYGSAERIITEGDEPSSLFLLQEGWVLSSIHVADGGRQVVKIHRAGDIMGLSSLPFTASVESLTALTPSRVSPIPLDRVGALLARQPRLGAVLSFLAQDEGTALALRLTARGRLNAKQSFVELLLSVCEADPTAGGAAQVYLPLTQTQLGDALGLSTVHVNRVVRELRADDLIHRDGYVYDLIDIGRLQALVGLPTRVYRRSPSWLPAPR